MKPCVGPSTSGDRKRLIDHRAFGREEAGEVSLSYKVDINRARIRGDGHPALLGALGFLEIDVDILCVVEGGRLIKKVDNRPFGLQSPDLYVIRRPSHLTRISRVTIKSTF